VPSKLASEYRVRVKMSAKPFAVDDSGESVIKKSSLEASKASAESEAE
jgi:hypothetical protein